MWLAMICFWHVLTSDGCHSIFWYILFYLFLYFFSSFSLWFSSFLFQPVFLMVFLARMMFLLVFNLTQQLLLLSLHSASYLFHLWSNFIINSRILTISSSGWYNFLCSFIFFPNNYFSVWYIFLSLFLVLLFFEHFVFLLQNCQIIWGVGVCDDFQFTHDLLTPILNNFSFSSIKAQLRYHFGFSGFGVKVSLQSNNLSLVLFNI